MLPETRVLDGDECVDQILRKILVGCFNSVRVGTNQRVGHFPGAIIYSRKISAWSEAVRVEVRRTVQNAFKHADKGADTCHAEKQNKNKGSPEEGQKQPVGVFLLPGIGCPDPFLGCFYTVIHENLLWVRSGSFY